MLLDYKYRNTILLELTKFYEFYHLIVDSMPILNLDIQNDLNNEDNTNIITNSNIFNIRPSKTPFVIIESDLSELDKFDSANEKISPDSEDEDFCCICNEKKIDTIIECMHAFCEKCIAIWLYNKSNSCPICRHDININKDLQVNNDIANEFKELDCNKACDKFWSLVEKYDIKKCNEDLKKKLNLMIDFLIN